MDEYLWRSIIDSKRAEESGSRREAARPANAPVNDRRDTYRDNSDNNRNNRYEYDEEAERKLRIQIERRRAARREAERRRVSRNRTVAAIVFLTLLVIIVIVLKACNKNSSGTAADSSSAVKTDAKTKTNSSSSSADSSSSGKSSKTKKSEHKIETENGMTFVDGVLIVNKTYTLPEDYDPGVSEVALNAFNEMADAAEADGITLWINSGYRSYYDQEALYNEYASERGTEEADKVSSRPGHSEHQSGLAFDVNTTSFSFEGTPEAEWLDEHCAEYGFIIRFPEGKEDITGYEYEPWHIRYLGTKIAKKVKDSGLCLEEYLGVTSSYEDSADQQ